MSEASRFTPSAHLLMNIHTVIVSYHEPFLVHYLDALVYPNVPMGLLVGCAVAVCVFNLVVYVFRYARRQGSMW